MTSGKGVEKCNGKRCPRPTQADGGLGGGGLTPQYRGEPRGNPPRTVWLAEREEHEQVISKILKIKQTNGDTRGRKNVDVHVQIRSKTVERNMKNTFKMTSGKGVGKYSEKRCPGQTQHMFGPY